ncbi:MAG: TM2 domain-containing protein [Akkermansiaceae bacterium]|nr:TM2 domain-containing protein [Akkermansiaceae bacterium]
MEHRTIFAAYVWLLLLGLFGAHRFYLGHTGWGFAYLFTLGFLGIGVLIDLFLIPTYVVNYNHRLDHALEGEETT